MNRQEQLRYVEQTLNSLLLGGITPPKTCSGLVKLFDGAVSRESLLSFFQQNEVKWVMGMDSGKSYELYNMEMNKCAEVYMSR